MKHVTLNVAVASTVGVSPRNNIILSIAVYTITTLEIFRGFVYCDAFSVRSWALWTPVETRPEIRDSAKRERKWVWAGK